METIIAACFDSYRAGIVYYNIKKLNSSDYYTLVIPAEDITGTTIYRDTKSVTVMRWIRKSIEDKTINLI